MASEIAGRLGLALMFEGAGPHRRFTVIEPDTHTRLGVYVFATSSYTRTRDGRITIGPVGEVLTQVAKRE